MAKIIEKEKAIILRKKGKSIKTIAKKLNISKSTVSLWCRDVELTSTQVSALHKNMVSGSYAGRMAGARMQYQRRLDKIDKANKKGKELIGILSERDVLIACTALYWGEGSKKTRQLSVNNSDPAMIKFIIRSFKEIWKVDEKDFTLRVGINIIHKKRDEVVRGYWSAITGMPLSQFRKTTFINSKSQKKYSNFNTHYGTLTLRINKSSHIYYQIMGLIGGLANQAGVVQ